jgi:tetratricopeptide (TPR) repeat protein
LLLALARRQVTSGQERDARATLTRALAIAPDRYPQIARLAQDSLASGPIDLAYSCLEIAVDAALLDTEFERAVAMLDQFLEYERHVPALRKLAAICREAGFEDRQRIVDAELELLREIGDCGVVPADSLPDQTVVAPTGVAVDVETLAAGIDQAIAAAAAARVENPCDPEGDPDLESVFEAMRARARQARDGRAAADEYDRGLAALERGDEEAAVPHLQAAARAPLFRFNASVHLGRLYAARGDLVAAVDWLERAAEAPSPTPDAGVAVLYDLACSLQRMDEAARALAVLLEIEADAPGYRDVRERIAQLSPSQAGSSHA